MSSSAADHFHHYTRSQWQALSQNTEFPLTEADVARIRGLSDPIDLEEADLVYRTLSGLLQVHVAGTGKIHNSLDKFLNQQTNRTPFVIGIAGSVAVGKSSTARLLQELLRRWPHTPHVELVTTDGFLYPNAELEKRGLMRRKGFPESYDRLALLNFLQAVKGGQDQVSAPIYDHLTYDILSTQKRVVKQPDILIVEGLNVLQPPRSSKHNPQALAISDFFDFSIYVDADATAIEPWYIERFMRLRRTAFTSPDSYFHRYSQLTDQEAEQQARRLWKEINLPNLEQNILPTRGRAKLILRKDANHLIQEVSLRKA